MQLDFDAHLPSADLNIVGMNKFGDEAANPDMAEKSDLPLLQDVDSNSDGESDVWTDYGSTWRDVVIIDRDGELSGVIVNLSSNDLRDAAIYDQVKADIAAYVTRNNVAQTAWQNRVEPLDVTGDGFVSPADVLANVIEINANGARELDATPAEVTLYHDVDGDGWLAPKDVLWTVIHLNRDTGGAGEPPARNAATEAVFAAFQAAYESQRDDSDS
jgi:hypothetical protein